MGRNRRPFAVAGLLALIGASASAQDAAEGQGLRFLPGVRSQITYSDNVLRRPGADAQSGFITEVTPYVRADYQSARTTANLDLSLRNIHRTVGDDNLDLLRPNLRARGNTALVGEWLWLEGSASVLDVNSSPFGALTMDPSLTNINRARYSTMTLSPYIVGQLGTFADYRTQYRFTSTRNSNKDVFLARDDQILSGNLTSGSQFKAWGWSLSGYTQRRAFPNNFSLGRDNAIANAYVLIGRELRLGASLNFDAIDRLTNSKGETSGWGPGLTLSWFPSSRTTLQAEVGRPYYGNTGSLRFSHRTQHLTFGLDYGRQVFTSNSSSVLFFNPATLLGGGLPTAMNPITQQLINSGLIVDQFGTLGAGVLTDALVLARNMTASIGYVGPRMNTTLTAFRSVRDTLIDSQLPGGANVQLGSSSTRYDQSGFNLANTVRLNARDSVNMMASTVRSSAANTISQSVRMSIVALSYQTRIDTKTTGSLGLRRTAQSSSTNNSAYDENVVFGTLDVRF